MRTADYAEMILTEEPSADPDVVIASAPFHDIGIKNAEEKYGSAEARYQEIEGPEVAGDILRKLDYSDAFIREVCDIVAHHHHPREDETTISRCFTMQTSLLMPKRAGRSARGVGQERPDPCSLQKLAADLLRTTFK